jgi:hypothetical protein
VVFLTEPAVSRATARALRGYVHGGGTLYGTASAGLLDEFNRTNTGMLELFGIHEAGQRTGSVALSLRTTAHPLHTIFSNISSASIYELTMRPNPRPAHGQPRRQQHDLAAEDGPPLGGAARHGPSTWTMLSLFLTPFSFIFFKNMENH